MFEGALIITGLVSGIKLFRDNRIGFYYFVASIVIGIVLGLLGYYGLTVETGIGYALVGSSLYQIANRI